MPPQPAAANIQLSDLGAYQHAVRLVLTTDVVTATRPRPGMLESVLRWADQLSKDLRDHLGYTLIATTRQVRLIRRLDGLDPTQTTIFTAKSGRPFDRRRLAYLCLILASFQRSRVEVSLADLVRAFTPTANAIDGLGFNPTVSAHKAAVVDVLDWLADRGALRLSDGSADAWSADTERGDALYDIDHDICAALFRPARPVQHLTSAAGLLDATYVSAKRGAQREAAAQRAARALLEHPVVYFSQVEPEVAEALRQTGVAENLARLTGLAVERRAEGVLLADAGGRFTDRPFPGRGGAVNRAAGLLLAKIADVLEDPDETPLLLPVPPEAADQRELLEKIDAALPLAGVVTELAWSAPLEDDPYPDHVNVVPDADQNRNATTNANQNATTTTNADPRSRDPLAPFIADSGLRTMINDLYDELGPASFTVTWQHDPRGLLNAAVAFLADLRLLRRVDAGVLVLPAAARYRNIKAALPVRHAEGQLALDLFGGDLGNEDGDDG
ncbi:MAG TPA: DUF2398 family protein [Trebonia sp.]|nr:DUF2398 family protein [Trebonia sp.]